MSGVSAGCAWARRAGVTYLCGVVAGDGRAEEDQGGAAPEVDAAAMVRSVVLDHAVLQGGRASPHVKPPAVALVARGRVVLDESEAGRCACVRAWRAAAPSILTVPAFPCTTATLVS